LEKPGILNTWSEFGLSQVSVSKMIVNLKFTELRKTMNWSKFLRILLILKQTSEKDSWVKLLDRCIKVSQSRISQFTTGISATRSSLRDREG
jgi:hypothetical protein